MAETPTITPVDPATPPTEPAAPADPPQKPLFANKYQTIEALEKAHLELTSQFDGPEFQEWKKQREIAAVATAAAPQPANVQPATSEQPAGTPKLEITKPPAAAERSMEQVLAAAGLTGQQLADHWKQHGQLADEHYLKLMQQGHNRAIVNEVMAGTQARAELQQYQMSHMVTHSQQIAGGENELGNLMNWAAANIPTQRIDVINKSLNDPSGYESAVKGLMYEHAQAIGAGGAQPLVTDATAPIRGGTTITTSKEYFEVLNKATQGDVTAQRAISAIEDPSIFS